MKKASLKNRIIALTLCAFALFSLFPAVSNATTGYTDVPENTWYTEAVVFCTEMGFMSGTGNGLFSPNVNMTRAMAVQVMAKVANADLSAYSRVSSFSDVPRRAWFHNAVEWAKANGITEGTGPGLFSPGVEVTREQCSLFLKKLSMFLGNETDETSEIGVYTDSGSVSGWAVDAVKWAVGCGFISGTSATSVSPRNKCTRAQLAVIISKFYVYYHSDCEHEWSEPDCTSGMKCLKCGYTRGAPLGHKYTPNCTENEICERCGKIIPPAGHTVEPDCTHGVTCPRCGTYLPATGHRHTEIRNVREPTLTVDGNTGDVYCLDCGALVKKGDPIPALCRHVFTAEEKDLFNKCNDLRRKNGLSPLKWKESIYPCASVRAHELAEKLSHERPNGERFYTVINDVLGDSYDYTGVSETYARYKAARLDTARIFNMWTSGVDIGRSVLSHSFVNAAVAIYHDDVNDLYFAVLFLEMP